MENNYSQSKKGALNPMFGKKQSYITKEKISAAQRTRYANLRDKLKIDEGQTDAVLSQAPNDIAAKRRVLSAILDSNAQLNSSDLCSMLAMILRETKLDAIVKEEINKLKSQYLYD